MFVLYIELIFDDAGTARFLHQIISFLHIATITVYILVVFIVVNFSQLWRQRFCNTEFVLCLKWWDMYIKKFLNFKATKNSMKAP